MLTNRGKALLRTCIVLLIQFVFILLKITRAVEWSWVVVLIPTFVAIGWELIGTILVLWLFRK